MDILFGLLVQCLTVSTRPGHRAAAICAYESHAFDNRTDCNFVLRFFRSPLALTMPKSISAKRRKRCWIRSWVKANTMPVFVHPAQMAQVCYASIGRCAIYTSIWIFDQTLGAFNSHEQQQQQQQKLLFSALRPTLGRIPAIHNL